MIMSKELIRNCQFKFKCTQQWELLETTDDIKIRHCSECNKSVHLCIDDNELIKALKLDQCVAIPRHYMSSEYKEFNNLFLTGLPDR